MRRMRGVVWTAAWAMLGLARVGAARAGVTSDRPAAIIEYPYIVVDTAHGDDTVLQLSNAASADTRAWCFFENATPHCSNTNQICATDLDCPPGGHCQGNWTVSDFKLRLTTQQPLGWRASEGLSSLPLMNQGVIPPVAEDPFFGSLVCITVDANDVPIDRNALKGEATLEHSRTLPSRFLDAAKYNAIGIPAIPGANNGDAVLVLGGPSAEYQACPADTLVNHFFDGALDPASAASNVFTKLVLVPCTQDLFVATPPGPVFVVYRTRNEFEQLFSASSMFECQQVGYLSGLSPLLSVGTAGTLTGQTRISTMMGGGVLAVAVEEHRNITDSTRVSTAAFNVHSQGDSQNPDTITTGENPCGNGRLDPGEQCDDGNTSAGDCCSPTCQVEPNGSHCNDGNACTMTDTCHAGVCIGSGPVQCPASGQCQLAGACNPATGACVYAPAPDGSPCNDGSRCTRTDRCVAGVCTGMQHVVCTSADQCHVGICNPATGMCSTEPVADGTTCDDSNGCTLRDTCEDGVCTGGEPMQCVPLDECHVAGTCDCGTCSNPPALNGTPCSGGGKCRYGTCNHPPDCSHAVASKPEIPADNKFVKIAVNGVTDPDGDPLSITMRFITQDEPVTHVADGDACPDGAGIGTDRAWVRAERDGGGDGRVYRVYFGASDGRGGRCRGVVTVCVPRTAGQGCVDQGVRVDSLSPCS